MPIKSTILKARRVGYRQEILFAYGCVRRVLLLFHFLSNTSSRLLPIWRSVTCLVEKSVNKLRVIKKMQTCFQRIFLIPQSSAICPRTFSALVWRSVLVSRRRYLQWSISFLGSISKDRFWHWGFYILVIKSSDQVFRIMPFESSVAG